MYCKLLPPVKPIKSSKFRRGRCSPVEICHLYSASGRTEGVPSLFTTLKVTEKERRGPAKARPIRGVAGGKDACLSGECGFFAGAFFFWFVFFWASKRK